MRIEELTMTLLNNDNCLSVQRWAGASTIEKMKFVSSNMLEPTQNIASLVAYLVKDAACHAGDEDSIPGLGRFSRGGNGLPFIHPLIKYIIIFRVQMERGNHSQILWQQQVLSNSRFLIRYFDHGPCLSFSNQSSF